MHNHFSISKFRTNTAIYEAWEKFTDSGELTSAAIRSVIGQRWVKSKELGIPTKKERAPTVITADEITELEKTEDLVIASKNALNNFEHALSQTEHVVVIADANSRILYSIGHREIQEQLESINFRPGADWSEQLVGPNGIGTSLSLGRPEIVMGYEHYCEAWQPWVCYGAPVYDVSGKVVKGTIDITGPVEKTSQESMAVAMSLASSISASLTVQQYKNRERLCLQAKHYLQRWSNDVVLILDPEGLVVDYSARAEQMFGAAAQTLLYQSLPALVPELGHALAQCVRSKEAENIELHHQQNADFTETMMISLQPIMQKQALLGLAAIVHVKNRQLFIPEHMLEKHASFQAIGDELILQTLAQTGYNVSKAARMLGLDRSTIYRRLRKRPRHK